MRAPKDPRVDEYITNAPEPARLMMKQIRTAIRSVAPEAEEKMSYGMPFYEYKFPGYKGRLAYFGRFKNHISFFAVPRHIPPDLAKSLEQYKAAKATLQFPLAAKVPISLLKKLVKLRMQEIDEEKKP